MNPTQRALTGSLASVLLAAVGFAGPASAQRAPELCFGMEPTVMGTDGDDELIGTTGDDVIMGLGGDDLIRGLEGNDRLCGNAQPDRIHGGEGRDRIGTGAGNDQAWGEKGADLITSPSDETAGEDNSQATMFGGPGNDRLLGGEGWYVMLHGQEGDDYMRGGWVNYRTSDGPVMVNLTTQRATGEGRDTLEGAHRVYGSPFDDRYYSAQNLGNQEIHAEGGNDWIEVKDGSSAVVSADAGNDVIVSVRGTEPVLLAFMDGELLMGGAGNDRITGSRFDDGVVGNRGHDYLNGGDGSDYADGGRGTDRCISTERSNKGCERTA